MTMRMLHGAVLGLTVVLIFIWPMPHTGSLRDLLLVSLCVLLGYMVAKRYITLAHCRSLRLPAYLLLALTCWLIFVALFLSSETAWSLSEIAGQWLRSLLVLAAGAGVGLWARRETARQTSLLTVIFLALLVHVVYLDGEALYGWVVVGEIPRRIKGLAEGLDRGGLIVWLAGAFLLAEIVIRLATKNRFIRAGNLALAGTAVAVLFGSYVADSRNSMIVLLMLTMLSIALYAMVRHPISRKRILILLVAVAIVLPLLSTVLVKADSRWQMFLTTVPLAWDTEHNRYWLEPNKYPVLPLLDGHAVDESTYYRVAWFKESTQLVAERPWGRGFGRQIFGHALQEKYGIARTQTHSHSGLMGLALGAGIPGAMLWIVFLFVSFHFGYRNFMRTKQYPALALQLHTAGFAVAMTLDSMMQDHMLQKFMFLTGLLWVLAVNALDENHSTQTARDP